jgi:hypothetical protein
MRAGAGGAGEQRRPRARRPAGVASGGVALCSVPPRGAAPATQGKGYDAPCSTVLCTL